MTIGKVLGEARAGRVLKIGSENAPNPLLVLASILLLSGLAIAVMPEGPRIEYRMGWGDGSGGAVWLLDEFVLPRWRF
jgi:hypothetical protein